MYLIPSLTKGIQFVVVGNTIHTAKAIYLASARIALFPSLPI